MDVPKKELVLSALHTAYVYASANAHMVKDDAMISEDSVSGNFANGTEDAEVLKWNRPGIDRVR